MNVTIEQFLVVRSGATEERVLITNCFWCGPLDNVICGLCHERGKAMRTAVLPTAKLESGQ